VNQSPTSVNAHSIGNALRQRSNCPARFAAGLAGVPLFVEIDQGLDGAIASRTVPLAAGAGNRLAGHQQWFGIAERSATSQHHALGQHRIAPRPMPVGHGARARDSAQRIGAGQMQALRRLRL